MRSATRVKLPALMILPFLLATFQVQAEIDSQAVRKAGTLFSRGDRALQSGNVEKARTLFEKAVAALPEFPQAHMGLGHIAMSEKRFDEALAQYIQAREGYPKMGAALFEIQSRRYADAQRQINDLRDSINQLRGQGAGSSNQQDVEYRVAQIENSISRLEAILPPDRDSAGEVPAEIWFYIGNAQFQLGRRDEAVESWQRCAELDPEFAMVHNNLAIALAQAGEVDRARTHLARAEELGFAVNPQFKAELGQAGGS